MIKLNNKGFAVSTILYGILALTILILMLIFGIMRTSKDMNEDLVESIEENINNCALAEINWESCYYSGDSCSEEHYLYSVCVGNDKTLVDQILMDNIAYADNVASTYVTSSSGINFALISSNTNGKGLYYTEKNTLNSQRTYYFRGDVENNYVSFAGQTWRIVRINEDGSIRLVKQDGVSNSAFNSNYNDNAYVGYMYGTTGASSYALTHTNTTNSAIKTTLDTWYTTHLSGYANLFAKDAGFCSDRSVASTAGTWESEDTALGYGTNTTYYGPYGRVYKNNQPQFACPNEKDDLFTLSTSSKGNKKLTNPIGLLTLDEVVYAGGKVYTGNSNYYLANNDSWWTMSPNAFSSDYAVVWLVYVDGSVFDGIVNLEVGVRPVINLSSTVEILDNGADGTKDNPYVIKAD